MCSHLLLVNGLCLCGRLFISDIVSRLRHVQPLVGFASDACASLAAGHHPPRSNGHHNNTQELLELLEPIMEVRHTPTHSPLLLV